MTPAPDAQSAALLTAVLRWREWCHRRVVSFHPHARGLGVMRHSMDCTPPPILRTTTDEQGGPGGTSTAAGASGQVIVPIAMLAKAPLRGFDISSMDGRPIPLLTSRQNTDLGVAMLRHGIELAGATIIDHDRLDAALNAIVGARLPVKASFTFAAALVTDGTAPTDPPTHAVSASDDASERNPTPVIRFTTGGPLSLQAAWPALADLVRDLAQGFLMLGVLPASSLGTRQVLKFSTHWSMPTWQTDHALHTGPAPRWKTVQELWEHALVSFRYRSRAIALDTVSPLACSSYHVEFELPAGLRGSQLEVQTLIARDAPATTYDLDTRDDEHATVTSVGVVLEHQDAADRSGEDILHAHAGITDETLWATSRVLVALTATRVWGRRCCPRSSSQSSRRLCGGGFPSNPRNPPRQPYR